MRKSTGGGGKTCGGCGEGDVEREGKNSVNDMDCASSEVVVLLFLALIAY